MIAIDTLQANEAISSQVDVVSPSPSFSSVVQEELISEPLIESSENSQLSPPFEELGETEEGLLSEDLGEEEIEEEDENIKSEVASTPPRLRGQELVEKIKELRESNPEIPRSELAEACGYSKTANGIRAMMVVYADSLGILPNPAGSVQKPVSNRTSPLPDIQRYTVPAAGTITLRKSWIGRIGAEIGDLVEFVYDKDQQSVTMKKVSSNED